MSGDLRISYRDVASLVPSARNARTHSDIQVAQIAASIGEFGFTNPVLTDGADGIIAGHGRVLAAQSLGLDKVPCIDLEGLSELQQRAYAIADNKLALNAGWDDALLTAELLDLQDLDFDLDLTGFDGVELEGLLARVDALGGDEVEDPGAEWRGMPEFNQEDKTAFQSLIVHFPNECARNEFQEVVGQKIGKNTRFIWFPEQQIERYVDKEYVATEPA